MCGLCGSFVEPGWSAQPALQPRLSLGRRELAEAAAALAATSGVRIAAWGRGFRVTGPTGRTLLADDLPALWAAVDRLGRRPADPLADLP